VAFRPPVPQIDYLPISEVTEAEYEFPWPDWQEDHWFYPKKLKLTCESVFRYVGAAASHAQSAGDAINKGGFDVLLANTCMLFASPFIGRYVNLPKVLYLQEPNRTLYEPLPRLPWIAEEYVPVSGLKRLKSAGRQWVDLRDVSIRGREELTNAKSYDRILVNSYFSRESVLRAYGISSKVCYLGIDPGMFKDLELPRENFVISVGTISLTKNVTLTIQAIARVPAAIRPRLVWVANNRDEDYFRECVRLAESLNVIFDPRKLIPDAELVSLLNRAQMMVYTPRLEPFGFAPIEANLCGLPVVAVAEGGVRETVIDGLNGLLVDHDPELLGQAISRLISDPELRLKLGRLGKERALTDFAMEASIDRLEDELFAITGKEQ
jgi:glycosyltransferase involved in cell wall biosynthesis